MHEVGNRPWGVYEVLTEKPHHKVKRVIIEEGLRLSLQRHKKRSEHWFIVEGEAIVTKGDTEIKLGAGDSIDIPVGIIHRIKNCGETKLIFIEVQTGNELREDDIERLEDDFNRD